MLVFPTRLFRPVALKTRLAGGVASGGVSLGGVGQVADTSGGGFWQIEFGEAILNERERLMTWRAMEAALSNGATPIIVPLCDRIHQPITPHATTVPFSDLTLFDDGVAWDQMEVEATSDGAYPLRAISMTLNYAGPQPLVGGEYFSILHPGNKGWRMYCVTRVISQGEGAAQIEFRPPLRATVADETPINFDSPRVVCRVNGDVGAMLDFLRFGKGQASFIESFPASLD